MKHIGLLLCAQVTEWKNRKKAVMLVGIVLIIGMISTFSYVKNREESNEDVTLKLGVANEDTSEYAKLLISYFLKNEIFSSYVEVVQEKKEVLAGQLSDGQLDAYLVIPADFAQSLMNMEHVPMQAVVSMRQPTKALIFRQVLEAYETYIKHVEVNCKTLYDRMKDEGFSKKELNAANLDISLDLIFTALGKDDFFRSRTVEKEQDVALTDHYMFTVLFFSGLFLFLPAGLRIFRLRQNGMVLRFQTMRISMWKVITATALPYVIVIAAAIGSLIAIGGIWEEWIVAGSVALFLLMLSIVLFFGTWFRKKKDYLFAFGMLTLVLSVLGGGIVPKQYLPDAWQTIVAWMPNERFVALMAGTEGAPERCVLITLTATVLFFVGSIVCLNVRREAGEDA